MQLLNIRICDLNPASYNPSKRLTGARMAKLMKSIKTIGQIQPITIDSHKNIIDGHRRVHALKALKKKMVFAIVNTDFDGKTIYREVNATSAKMNGNDNLGIWLKDPEAVTPRTNAQLAAIENSLGREILQLIYKSGMSISVHRLAVPHDVFITHFADLDLKC